MTYGELQLRCRCACAGRKTNHRLQLPLLFQVVIAQLNPLFGANDALDNVLAARIP